MKRPALASSVLALASSVLALSAIVVLPYRIPGSSGFALAADSEPDAPIVQSMGKMTDGLNWGMNHVEVTKVYNAIGGLFDKEYDPILARTQPGVQMQAVEADRENRKTAFATSFLEFADTPTGYDATGVKDEYTYRNHESVMIVDKEGKRRYLFFIGAPPSERLWKIYDEVPLKAGGVYGASYAEAVAKLQGLVGAAPRVLQPGNGPSGPRRVVSSDWQDTGTHLRVDDRSGDGVVAVVLEDKRTLASLPQLRAVKPVDPFAIDPSIAAITHGTISDPNAAQATPDAGAGDKKKKKR